MIETEIQHQKMVKAQAILLGGCEPEIINENVFKVPSTKGRWDYTVRKNNDLWTCACPSYHKLVEARIEPPHCKHIHVIKFWLELKEGLETEYVNKKYRTQDFHACKFCGTFDVVNNGYRKTKSGKKPILKCKECGRTFSLTEEGFENMKFSPEIVSECLDLYFNGMSLRKITHHMKQAHNGLKIGHVIIHVWIKRYTKIISSYVDTLKPELGDMWHADEMTIKVKSDGVNWGPRVKRKYKNQAQIVWMWNVLDGETRFLIASMVSKKKNVKDARKVFQMAKNQAQGKPKVVTTDGLGAYHKAFNKVFWDHHRTCEHISEVGIADKVNNNRVERLHGTIRERAKVMRALGNPESSEKILDGHRVYYNFVRPHTALNDKTPAEEAKINLELGHNKWKGLIEKAVGNGINEPEKQGDKESLDYWVFINRK